MDEIEIKEYLKEQWATVNERYEQIKVVCEAAVVRWEWAFADRYFLEPYEQAISGFRSDDSILEEKPEEIGWHSEYGFDVLGRLRVSRNYLGSADYMSEQFNLVIEGDLLSITYGAIAPKVKQLKRVVIKDGNVTYAGCLQHSSYIGSSYIYNDKVLQQLIRRSQHLRPKKSGKVKDLINFLPDSETSEYLFEWDEEGLKQILQVSPLEADTSLNKPTDIVFEREAAMPKSELVSILAQEIRLIIAEFKADHGTEDWYSFALTYDHLGVRFRCAFETEQALSRSAWCYDRLGYRFKYGENFVLLRELLRYSPWDSFYFYRLISDRSLSFKEEWRCLGVLGWQFPDDLKSMSLAVLRILDAEGAFGVGVQREQITIGVSEGSRPDQFAASCRLLNPSASQDRLRTEFKQMRKLSSPGMLEIVEPNISSI